MKYLMMIISGAVIISACSPNKNNMKATEETVEIKNETDSLSYAIGVNLGSSIKSQDMDSINVDLMTKAFKDAYSGDSTLLNEDDALSILQNYMRKKQMADMEAKKAEGQEFLSKNEKRPEVQVTASGLQYEVVSEGSGPKPAAEDKVKVHYTGKLLNGDVFDSSVERGQPATFGVNQVIPGWTEALQMMPVGAKWKLYIPSDLAYGPRGAGKAIGPNETLVFDVELLEIMDKNEQ